MGSLKIEQLKRIENSSAIVVSHSMGLMNEICDSGVVLINGKAKLFNDVKEAIDVHNAAMTGSLPNWAIG